MNPTVSLELRWFLYGTPAPQLGEWFLDTLPGVEVSPLIRRDDLILFQPNSEDVYVKLVGERIVIKWRKGSRQFKTPGKANGKPEFWCTWNSSEQPGEFIKSVTPFQDPQGPWLKVKREGRQRKYLLKGNEFVPIDHRQIIDAGLLLELVSISLQEHPYTLINFKTFGRDDKERENLMSYALDFLNKHPVLSQLPFRQSFGFPRWLKLATMRRISQEPLKTPSYEK